MQTRNDIWHKQKKTKSQISLPHLFKAAGCYSLRKQEIFQQGFLDCRKVCGMREDSFYSMTQSHFILCYDDSGGFSKWINSNYSSNFPNFSWLSFFFVSICEYITELPSHLIYLQALENIIRNIYKFSPLIKKLNKNKQTIQTRQQQAQHLA